MKRIIGSIQDFINIKRECIFCQSLLVCNLTNLMGSLPHNFYANAALSICDISAPLFNKEFGFTLKYDGERSNFNVDAFINTVNNRFHYYCRTGSAFDDSLIFDVFARMQPYIELYCSSIHCEQKYCIQSDSLRINSDSFVRPISIKMETFLIDNWWVGNLYGSPGENDSNTFIYSHLQPNQEAITCQRLDFETFDKDKLLNRVRNVVTFG